MCFHMAVSNTIMPLTAQVYDIPMKTQFMEILWIMCH